MVFNYAMNLQKQSDRSVPLFGAKFTFYVDEEMTRLVYFVPVGTEDQKMYRVGKAEDAGAITEIPADFTLVGGSTGTVYFKETTVPILPLRAASSWCWPLRFPALPPSTPAICVPTAQTPVP